MRAASAPPAGGGGGDEERVAGMSVKELKNTIDDAGLSHADCFEKPELRKRAAEALAKGTGGGDGGGDTPPAPPPKDVHKRKGGGGGFLGRALSFRSKERSPSMNRQDSLSFQPGDLETTEFDIPMAHAATKKGSKKKGKQQTAHIKAFHAGLYRQIRCHYSMGGAQLVGALGVRRILGSILLGDLAGLSGCVSAGKSGSFFFKSPDGLFMVKTISSSECENLQKMTEHYCRHVKENPASLLCRMLGHFQMVVGCKVCVY